MKQLSSDRSALRIGLALSAALSVVLVTYFWFIFHHGELRDKVAYGDLGALVSTHSLKPGKVSVLRDYDGAGFDMLGYGSDRAPRVHWIELNEIWSDDDVFGADNQPIAITCDRLDQVLRPVRVDEAVSKHLHQRCQSGR